MMTTCRARELVAALAALALVGCGDDGAGPADAPPPYTRPEPIAVALSAAGPDQFQAVAPGPDGSFYAAGFAAADLAGPAYVVVAKLTATGRLDVGFGGGDGIATTPLDFRGEANAAEVAIVVQPAGTLVVAATIAHAGNPFDHDVGVVRLDAAGGLDASFGAGGVRVLDLTTAVDNGAGPVGRDGARGLAVDPTSGALYVYAVSRNPGLVAGEARTDTDFTVVKLDAGGVPDGSYGGGDGRFTYDVQLVSEAAHGINVLAGGDVMISGYANSPGLGSAQPVLIRLSPAGAMVASFAAGGVFHDIVLALQTEVYNVVPEGGHGVTCGYGRDTGSETDWVSLRFDLATGARDLTWGGAAKGAVLLDPSGTRLSDNCRNAVALPDDRTLLVGTVGPANQPTLDAAFAVLDPTGHLDAAFAPGTFVYSLGGYDSFWAGAVSGANAIVVGSRGGGPVAMQTATMNDDAYALIMPLP